ncbi:DCL family protein [Bartonella sp. LJL80]
MGNSRKINLSSRPFDTVGEATVFFTRMLNAYNIGERVSEKDEIHLRGLIERHDEPDEKVGPGIDHFEVNIPPEHSGKCFWAVWFNGHKIDFSIRHCLKPHPNDKK